MGRSVYRKLWTSCLLVLGAALVVFFIGGTHANAFPSALNAWQMMYPGSTSGDTAQCQLCHELPPPVERAWNGYGFDFLLARGNMLGMVDCDFDSSGTVSFDEAFLCIEGLDSDLDPGAFNNLDEILMSTQPGWTNGPNNTIFTESDVFPDQLPPNDIGPLDPGGAGGTGGAGGMGGTGGEDMFPPGQFVRHTIVVMPGQSIQAAIDRAQEGTRIYVLAGVYEEPNNPTNGLNITKSGIHLIGQTNTQKRVILQSTGNQRNGIVIVPPFVPAAAQPQGADEVERNDCMGCHTDLAPPFPLHPNVPMYIPLDTDPYLDDIKVESITIQGFRNNGLFGEHLNRFLWNDIVSIDNRNYGIFPVLSKNGVISDCHSTGSDLDSALWVETSEHVLVTGNLVENSVNGIEVSNSDDVLVIDNEMRNNTLGLTVLFLPDIFDNKGSLLRIDAVNNWIHDNNKPNTARPNSILSFIPRGIGALYVGADDSLVSGNLVEGNDFVGIAVVDYCLPFQDTPFDCSKDDDVTPEFLALQAAENNTVAGNNLVNNGTNPDPDNPFLPFAADLTFLVTPPPFPPDHGNCFEDNIFTTFFSTLGVLPPCP